MIIFEVSCRANHVVIIRVHSCDNKLLFHELIFCNCHSSQYTVGVLLKPAISIFGSNELKHGFDRVEAQACSDEIC